jgi:putative acetyltransferase
MALAATGPVDRLRCVSSWVIRAEQPEDHDAIRVVVAAAFKDTNVADLVEAIRAAPEYAPELALVAEVDGEIVGHVMVSFTALDDGTTCHQIFQLSPLAVAPEQQGTGVGSALVRTALERAKEMGAEFVVLEGDPRYYSRFGFEPSADYGIFIDLPEWAPPEAAQIRLLAGTPPSVSGRVVYPESFARVTDHRRRTAR